MKIALFALLLMTGGCHYLKDIKDFSSAVVKNYSDKIKVFLSQEESSIYCQLIRKESPTLEDFKSNWLPEEGTFCAVDAKECRQKQEAAFADAVLCYRD